MTAQWEIAMTVWNTMLREKDAIKASGADVPAILVGRIQGLQIALESMGYSSTGIKGMLVSFEKLEEIKEKRIANFEKKSVQSKKSWQDRLDGKHGYDAVVAGMGKGKYGKKS
jgi:hypothetical protein